ncbi:zeta toxin family protein [Marinobacter bryozoorum]|uniref:zeta toxin family protein n=1 Tax=Marinobacter bryozoorum TaxID=256324 RepID=UPI002005FA5B|nr:zeta toxin family protein [Marinobacter bryozoorum]MCK7545800.1 zeta toxin family protein [Marinobacter bryozoorum]
MNRPTCWIIAGPNGSGKTTFARDFLPQVAGISRFINADLIAAGLSPFAPEKELVTASRLFLKQIDQCIQSRENFSFETTLSGRSYLGLVKQLKSNGWRVELTYLALPTPELSRLRVAERVYHGGHNIPEKDIQRRFPRSLRNLLHEFSSAADHCTCLMNSDRPPTLVFENQGEKRIIHNKVLYRLLIAESRK